MTNIRLAAAAALLFYGLGMMPGLAASPAGRYCGEMISSGDYRDVETLLNIDKSGRIVGTYLAGDPAGRLEGTLAERDGSTGTSRALVWTDKYGTGILNLDFSDDFGQFKGSWGALRDGKFEAASHSWNGARCARD